MSDYRWAVFANKWPKVAMFVCTHMARWYRDVQPNTAMQTAWHARAWAIAFTESTKAMQGLEDALVDALASMGNLRAAIGAEDGAA